MEINTLIATIEKKPNELLDKMKVKGKVYVSSQNGNNIISKTKNEDFDAMIYEIPGSGVSINRNLLLMQSTGDVLVFADDDLIFRDDYLDVVQKYYKKLDADILIFNLGEKHDYKSNVQKITKITKFNYQRYGAARITVKRVPILKHGLFFNVFFGGGSPIGSGEDTIFLKRALDSDMKIFAIPDYLARMQKNSRRSTWFSGYNKKFFYDKGQLFENLYGIFKYPYIFRFAVKRKYEKKLNIRLTTIVKWMIDGARDYKKY